MVAEPNASPNQSPAERLAAKKPRRVFKAKPKPSAIWKCRLSEQRSCFGLTLDDVADALSISKTGLWQVEHGNDPMLSTAFKLAQFYGLPIESIWKLKGKD